MNMITTSISMMMDRTVKIIIIPVDENESFFDSESDVELFRVVGVSFPCGSAWKFKNSNLYSVYASTYTHSYI